MFYNARTLLIIIKNINIDRMLFCWIQLLLDVYYFLGINGMGDKKRFNGISGILEEREGNEHRRFIRHFYYLNFLVSAAISADLYALVHPRTHTPRTIIRIRDKGRRIKL